MSYINTNIPQAGIVSLLYYKKSTGKALSGLAHTLLHGPSSLTPAERELIAAHVSYLNNCEFCFHSHAGVASSHLNDNGKAVECVVKDLDTAPVSDKMKALLRIAEKVQQSGRAVTPELIDAAKKKGATDEEIHDAVLVAAAFCMYNRYVDGLNTALPVDKQEYEKWGTRLANKGYKYAPGFMLWFVRKMMRKEPTELRPRAESWK
jgi:uncharacterized peroxidase-related enzyme